MIVWLNGSLHDESEARISPFDHGLLTGDGVFEAVRVYAGEPFAWTRHLKRLERSASGLGLDVPDGAVLHGAAIDVLAANQLTDARLRITVTGGPSPLGSLRGEAPPTVLVAAHHAQAVTEPTDVAMSPWPRNERGALAGLKTISYAENVRALAWARERGAGEAIFPTVAGSLCEGTGTNIFLVEHGRVVTPPLDSGCLDGVTRRLVLELCREEGVEAAEEHRLPQALGAAAEAFLTSTMREVNPIRRVDGAPLATCPGPVTSRLAEAFRRLVGRTRDP